MNAYRDLRVALLGCGSVGAQVARLILEHGDELAARIGAGLTLTGIAVRSLDAKRDVELPQELFTTDAEQLVLGHPINMNGSLGPRSQLVRDFAELLATKTELPIDLVDERATTVRAHQILSTTNVRGQKRKQTADAVAAVLILETYMQRRKNAGGQ